MTSFARRARRLLQHLPGGSGFVRAIDLARADRRHPQKHLPGHYSSPIVDLADLPAGTPAAPARIGPPGPEIVAIDHDKHDRVFAEFQNFTEGRGAELVFGRAGRYHPGNGWFSAKDAALLAFLIERQRPARVVEMGSGFSSAVLLDTLDHYEIESEVVFIEPFPERLEAQLRPADRARCRILKKRIEQVPIEQFEVLQPGDVLFVDGSHVLKAGSDLNWLLFEVLPMLRSGVWIHFHDVFWPFDYPRSWFERGFHWNEAYALRAFLSYNTRYQIEAFNSLFESRAPAWFEHTFAPDPEPASSLWLAKIEQHSVSQPTGG